MPYRIYVDESGTHDDKWLVIGMLFVPDHGSLHSALCKVKESIRYLNNSPKRKARYRETHFTQFRSPSDVDVGKLWIDLFFRNACYFRSVVVDWSIWDPKYFGDAFEPEALRKRRAYKKWAEMLLHREIKAPTLGTPIYHASLYLDRLRIMYGYDVIDHLRERFTANYEGSSPYIVSFQHTPSWLDANQCLQLCDLLTGCLYQSLVPATKNAKVEVRAYLEETLRGLGVDRMTPGFWRQYVPETLTKHFPKFSAWFWRPSEKKKKGSRKR